MQGTAGVSPTSRLEDPLNTERSADTRKDLEKRQGRPHRDGHAPHFGVMMGSSVVS